MGYGNRLFWIFCICLGGQLSAKAQFPPQAGIEGSTAIPADSELFIDWATGCTIYRGYLDIADPDLGRARSGEDGFGTGAPDGQVVSLGDSGVALLTFDRPVVNGPGPDFAVFENGFVNPANPEEAYLELAFVEVSSDGVRFFRFEAESHTPVDVQVPGDGVYMNARLVHNLAGKYRSYFGTPFDLEELKDKPGLDVNHITHIRIVDVIGTVGSLGTADKDGRVINDPYPTSYAVGTGGFDLDAVGIIHQVPASVPDRGTEQGLRIYPNPVRDALTISVPGQGRNFQLLDNLGRIVRQGVLVRGSNRLDMTLLPGGVYFLQLGAGDVFRVLKTGL